GGGAGPAAAVGAEAHQERRRRRRGEGVRQGDAARGAARALLDAGRDRRRRGDGPGRVRVAGRADRPGAARQRTERQGQGSTHGALWAARPHRRLEGAARGGEPVTPQDAFLRAILDAPDDDAPRLVYADWLDEHGETERAEFIRVQITLASLAEDSP